MVSLTGSQLLGGWRLSDFRTEDVASLLSTRSAVSRGCSPLVSVTGGTPSGIWTVNDFRPSDVEAIEVYRGNRMLDQGVSRLSFRHV